MKNRELSRKQAREHNEYRPPARWYIEPARSLIWCDECHYWHSTIAECEYI